MTHVALVAATLITAALIAGVIVRAMTDPPAHLLERAARAIHASAAGAYVVQEAQVHYLKPAQYEMHAISWAHNGYSREDQEWAGVHQSFGLSPGGGWSSSDGIVVSLPPDTARADRTAARFRELLLKAARRPSAFARSAGWRKLPNGQRVEGVRISIPGEAPIVVDFDGRHPLPVAVEMQEPGYNTGLPVNDLTVLSDYVDDPDGVYPRTRKRYTDGVLASVTHILRREVRPGAPAGTFVRPPSVSGSGTADVPVEIVHGLPFVRASINGSRPLRFMIDTGCGITALTHLGAEAAGVRPAGYLGTTFWLSIHRTMLGRAASIRVGNGVAHSVVVGFGVPGDEHDYGDDYGGLLGFDFLARFQPTLDYLRGRLILRPIDSPAPIGDSTPMLVNGGWIFVDGAVFGRQLCFQLDTGTRRTLVPANYVHVPLFTRPRRAGYTDGPGGKKLDEYQYIAPSLRVGSAETSNFPVYTIEGAPDRAPIVGSKFLRGYRITLDYQGGRVTIR